MFRGLWIVPILLLTAAAPEVPASSTAPEQTPTVILQTFAPREAMPLLGQRVVEPDGKTVARLIDVLVDLPYRAPSLQAAYGLASARR
jgi:hypothetical protein